MPAFGVAVFAAGYDVEPVAVAPAPYGYKVVHAQVTWGQCFATMVAQAF